MRRHPLMPLFIELITLWRKTRPWTRNWVGMGTHAHLQFLSRFYLHASVLFPYLVIVIATATARFILLISYFICSYLVSLSLLCFAFLFFSLLFSSFLLSSFLFSSLLSSSFLVFFLWYFRIRGVDANLIGEEAAEKNRLAASKENSLSRWEGDIPSLRWRKRKWRWRRRGRKYIQRSNQIKKEEKKSREK